MSADYQNIELCTYCMFSSHEYERSYQLICCHPRHHIITYANMLDKDRTRYKICNKCCSLSFLSLAPAQL